MDILLSSIVAGLLLGMVLAIVALGLTIIFGVMDIVNFAHGEFLMVGMYTGLLTAQATGIDPLLTLPFAALVGFLLGVEALKLNSSSRIMKATPPWARTWPRN